MSVSEGLLKEALVPQVGGVEYFVKLFHAHISHLKKSDVSEF